MTDAPELIYACYDKEFDATYWVGPDTVYLTRHSVGEYRRADLPRPQDAARIAELEAALERIAAMDRRVNYRCGDLSRPVHVDGPIGKIARAALAADSGATPPNAARTVDASRLADPDSNGDSQQRGAA